jgi:hypothetical protein
LVVITTTPFAACAPYCAAAEASLSTSTEAMSSGFRFGFCCRYMPSTTYSGVGLPRPICPRTITSAARPGSPEEAICTPGTRPRSASSTVATCCSWRSAPVTLDTASDTSRRCCVV